MEENKIMVYIPLELFLNLSARAEQIAVIERLVKEKKYMALNELMAIIATDPFERKTDREPERGFREMFKDTPGLECVLCDQ